MKFPDENPNPCSGLARRRMTYANPASAPGAAGARGRGRASISARGWVRLCGAWPRHGATVEVEVGAAIFALRVVSVYEFDSINLYGTDITAARQVERARERAAAAEHPAGLDRRAAPAGETVIADRFDDMAVLFADVVGFTPFAGASPRRGRRRAERGLLDLRPARRPVRAREDQDDRRRVHGRRRASRRRRHDAAAEQRGSTMALDMVDGSTSCPARQRAARCRSGSGSTSDRPSPASSASRSSSTTSGATR